MGEGLKLDAFEPELSLSVNLRNVVAVKKSCPSRYLIFVADMFLDTLWQYVPQVDDGLFLTYCSQEYRILTPIVSFHPISGVHL